MELHERSESIKLDENEVNEFDIDDLETDEFLGVENHTIHNLKNKSNKL